MRIHEELTESAWILDPKFEGTVRLILMTEEGVVLVKPVIRVELVRGRGGWPR